MEINLSEPKSSLPNSGEFSETIESDNAKTDNETNKRKVIEEQIQSRINHLRSV